MPKEQGERVLRMASKNAKDKSNSATLLATRAKAQAEHEASGRGSRCSSEKDSGYSDTGSDSLQTDSEDQRSTVRLPKARDSHLGSHPGNAMLMPGTQDLAPIFIIKNVVLKQPVQAGQEQLLQAPLPWGGAGSNGQGPTHVLLLQQPEVTSQQAPMQVLKPQPRRADGGSKKSKATYLPIFNSYPRIAPHPSKKTDKANAGVAGSGGGGSSSSSSSSGGGVGGGGGTAEDPRQSKRVCTEEKREEVSTTSQLPKQHINKQPESRVHSHARSHSTSQAHFLSGRNHELPSQVRLNPHPPFSPSTSASLGSPSVSSTETALSPSSCELAARPLRSSKGQNHQHQQHHRHGSAHGALSSSGRHRRFLNTVEILSQSGLLDITLRTQDLLRQSTATERDIAQLRHHTQLLCQAAQSYPTSPEAWDRIHQAMVDSGHYPSLKRLDSCGGAGSTSPTQIQAEADTSSNGKVDLVVSLALSRNHHEEMAPPSPILAPIDDLPLDLPTLDQNGYTLSPTGQSRGQATNTKPLDDLLMPPDSSTHSPLL